METALDIGIDEDTYWNMSIGEVARRAKSYERTYRRKLKDKASFDWILGNLIGISVGRCLSSDATYPEIYEAYPTIFSSEEVGELKQKEQDERSVANFLAFATAHNLRNKMKEGGNVSG